jgi:tripartite-type tricarboxylate transporter receptor subunit TctC
MMTQKRVAVFIVSTLLILSWSMAHGAEDYPSKPINLYIGYPPGGATGPYGQVFAENAKKYFANPQPILVNYKPGAASAIAADYVLKQPADGYSLLVFPWDLIVKLVKDGQELSFKMEDFIPIGVMGYVPAMLTVHKEKGNFAKLEDFIDQGKKNPGKISYGSPGIGAGHHLTGVVLEMRCSIKLKHVPFAGGGPALTALLGGHIDSAIQSITTFGANIKPGGELRALATFSQDRLQEFPDVPTFIEKGYDINRTSWYYLSAPKGTPKSVVDILVRVFKQTAEDPQTKIGLQRIGFVPMYLNPEGTAKKARGEYELTKEILKIAGL